MKLTELDPQRLVCGGKRVGFVFKCPTDRRWWQTCFFEVTPTYRQDELIEKVLGESAAEFVQRRRPDYAWGCVQALQMVTFEQLSVTPSLDGSKGGLWHGHITNGDIVGGLG